MLNEWFQALYRAFSDRGDIQVVAVYTPSDDDTLHILKANRAKVIVHDEGTHGKGRDWTNRDRIETLAVMRNRLLDEVALTDAAFFLSLDSDVLLGGDVRPVLNHLHLAHDDVVAPHVRLAEDHSITSGFTRRKDGYYTRVRPDYDGRVHVVCAAVFMRMEVVRDRNVRYAYHPRGEDFAWSNSATDAGYRLGMCTELPTIHRMGPLKWLKSPAS